MSDERGKYRNEPALREICAAMVRAAYEHLPSGHAYFLFAVKYGGPETELRFTSTPTRAELLTRCRELLAVLEAEERAEQGAPPPLRLVE